MEGERLLSTGQAARRLGISVRTLYRWEEAGRLKAVMRLPTGQRRFSSREIDALARGRAAASAPRCVIYARVASHDQRDDLERQVKRLREYAERQGWADAEVVAEIGSGLNGKRKRLLKLLRSATVVRIVVEHRDRLARCGFEMVEAALASAGKQVLVVEDGEVTDDLVLDLLEILTSACGRLYGRRSARHRARRAVEVLQCL